MARSNLMQIQQLLQHLGVVAFGIQRLVGDSATTDHLFSH